MHSPHAQQHVRPWNQAGGEQQKAWFNYGLSEQTFITFINQVIKRQFERDLRN